ncbi:MAG: MFS transporter [Acidobacteria bacterium]|nr:MFS transporter [Acidobacteriota bacterium]
MLESEEAVQTNRKAVWSWCLYDFANSPFTTLIVTFIYASYFTAEIAPDSNTGTIYWSRGVTITAIVVAALSPFMGALADLGGLRKRLLLSTTLICVLATAGLFFVLPGQIMGALTLFVVGNIAFEMGMVFYNAFLPDIAPAEKVGRISGIGWGLGYVGGLLALVVALVGFIQPEQPWFGFSTEQSVRATCLLTAVWFAVFSIPIFLWVPEEKPQPRESSSIVKDSMSQLVQTFRDLRQYRQIMRFLIARLLYNDGLITVFAFGGIYATGTFGFEIKEILVFGIVLNIAAGAGAFAMGFMDDVLGGKMTIQISLVGLLVATIIAVTAPNATVFWIGGILVGIFSGPNQSASRSLMGRMVPDDKENEFFGFFAFSGKATAFLGPTMFGLFTGIFDTQRAGVASVILLLVAGWWVLQGVDEGEGIRLASRKA